jgi:hypothetical protein
MNDFQNLTDEQVFQLTAEQINFYVDLECAKEGVLLLPDTQPVEPQLTKPQPDALVYEVGNFCVTSAEEAATLLEALQKVKLVRLDYDGSTGYDSKYIKRLDTEVEAKPIKCYSPEVFASIRESLTEYTLAKNTYAREYNEYRDITAKRDKAAKWIWDRVEEIREKYVSQERMAKEFQRYLTLANGDKTIALNFLKNAYSLSDAELAFLSKES